MQMSNGIELPTGLGPEAATMQDEILSAVIQFEQPEEINFGFGRDPAEVVGLWPRILGLFDDEAPRNSNLAFAIGKDIRGTMDTRHPTTTDEAENMLRWAVDQSSADDRMHSAFTLFWLDGETPMISVVETGDAVISIQTGPDEIVELPERQEDGLSLHTMELPPSATIKIYDQKENKRISALTKETETETESTSVSAAADT